MQEFTIEAIGVERGIHRVGRLEVLPDPLLVGSVQDIRMAQLLREAVDDYIHMHTDPGGKEKR
jgi:hypothetical protein